MGRAGARTSVPDHLAQGRGHHHATVPSRWQKFQPPADPRVLPHILGLICEEPLLVWTGERGAYCQITRTGGSDDLSRHAPGSESMDLGLSIRLCAVDLSGSLGGGQTPKSNTPARGQPGGGALSSFAAARTPRESGETRRGLNHAPPTHVKVADSLPRQLSPCALGTQGQRLTHEPRP